MLDVTAPPQFIRAEILLAHMDKKTYLVGYIRKILRIRENRHHSHGNNGAQAVFEHVFYRLIDSKFPAELSLQRQT